MSIVVGVDAGGTSTTVAVSRDGTREHHEFGPANVSVSGIDGALHVLRGALEAALAGGLPHAIVVGAAGAGRHGVGPALATALRTTYPTSYVDVGTDARIALRAAVRSGDGAVLISGTGSMAYAEYGDRRVRAGGYGYAFGDEGSAFSIGVAALRHAGRVRDGRAPADALSETVVSRAGDFDALLHDIYGGGATVARTAALASLVVAAADAGERSANRIVQAAALELFELLKTVLRAAPATDDDVPVALGGGVLQHNSILSYLLETRIAHELPRVRTIKNPPAPVEGALALAEAAIA